MDIPPPLKVEIARWTGRTLLLAGIVCGTTVRRRAVLLGGAYVCLRLTLRSMREQARKAALEAIWRTYDADQHYLINDSRVARSIGAIHPRIID